MTRTGRRRVVSGFDCDVLVIGGGIVGLSTAYALTRSAPGTRVVVLEKEEAPARHQTGRNSGVIHSGIYYRPGSLKARYAVTGAAEMVKFCAEHGLPHRVTGKLIVATRRDELPRLHSLVQRGRENGIPVRELGPAQIAEYEPGVRGLAAIHVGTTGVCDYGAVAEQLAVLAGAAGAEVRCGEEVVVVDRRPWGVAVRTASGTVLRARALVNCAGLHCDRVARLTGDDPEMRIVPFRGEYYELTDPSLVRGLVYPVPDPAFPFLGVHLTRGIDGSVHVGPNAVPALAREGYGWGVVRPGELAATLSWPGSWHIARRHWRYGAGELRRSLSKEAFAQEVRRLLPAVTEEALRPTDAGVRAQAVLRDGTLVDDFLIRETRQVVHVLNAPSPAATASLPIGREVARRVRAML
ncbi:MULTISPECIES: L-2-hydroxyglutarate oxidase [Streptomyces]|uniref:L-2-hydroxyglutarate oxidase n=1 Tax=Streptomyces tsukubensis (strain DSM 42081 / NBRC 108919 / NRRL 18488 / 9993) TaxID=1114943 RepID=A0A7G3UJ31_STRT9|nr:MULTISPECIES: L-2-hydroxyglutarate oxidase [Streptomyces]AZK95002.1 hydroxyglutarate oxidase [Streptomyces tsukubensis]MYS63143.1 L-2-hydroxyglutarate oxidase [Streptomyces sp. SID5473]QKM68932.1 L-2-hydroxyglutarate oxidase [Streptomyces tsukubensis NRRL18488]TAI43737.1 L-2-hydroxyglutarate oxidase [Streptomyces tsukubensis]